MAKCCRRFCRSIFVNIIIGDGDSLPSNEKQNTNWISTTVACMAIFIVGKLQLVREGSQRSKMGHDRR